MWPYSWTHVGTPSHLGHMDRVAATMPSQAHAGAAQEAPNIGQWEGQDVPLVRPSSCTVKGGIPSSRRYLPTYLEEDKARIANPRVWPVSKDDLRSLKEDMELRIFQISEEQQRLELRDRWKSHYNEFQGRSVDRDETDLLYQYLDDDRFIVDGDDVYLDVWAVLNECHSVSRDEYEKSNLGSRR